ncbi:MAG: DedA family protein [Coriobacteriia bacterium]|nr:DedA family protein [Coriobacteriia bacterium]
MLQIVDFILHIDVHLGTMMAEYGVWIYAIIFLLVVLETGLVVTPFLPGDSMLFAAGSLAAMGHMDFWLLLLIMPLAAIIGDASNYMIGKYFGSKLIERDNNRFIKKKHIDDTQKFFVKHGGKTIIIARFMPFVRTFAPFIAGVGHMSYKRFASFNIIGGFSWTWLFLIVGYYFGNISFIKKNFSLTILAMILISLVPIFVMTVRKRYGKNAGQA